MREIQDGWSSLSVGEISPVQQYGYTTSASDNAGGPKFLRITDIQDGIVDWDTVPYCEVPPGDIGKFAVGSGDILVARTGGTVGKSFLISDVPSPTVFASYLIRLSVGPDVVPRFLYHFFQSADYWRQIGLKKGGLLGNVSASSLASIEVPICSIPQQQRIVSKIDELFSRIDEGERALERVQKLVERYRQSVLKAAVTGELTREWREKNAGKIESGEALLARILDARRAAWEKTELEKMKAKGVKPANDTWKEKYAEPTAPDTTELPELPEGWTWASIDQVGVVSGGLTKNSKRASHKIKRPYLRVANVYMNRLDLTDVHEIGVAESELDRVSMEVGDLLVVEGNGSIDQIGRVAIWDGSVDGCVHQNHLIKVRCTTDLPSWYVLIWCMSPMGRELIERVASSTAGLHTLSISKIQAIPLPIPSAGELRLMLDSFDEMESVVANQRASLNIEARRTQSLRQAVLKTAFDGSLVPQDPTDEPASALLERIAAQRNQPAPTSTPRHTRKSKA